MKTELTPELLARLKEKAEKATPGPWDVDSLGNIFLTPHAKDEDYQPVVLLTKNSLDEYAPTEADAAYIAAANPSVMLAMIARIEELEANNYGPEILNDPQALTVSYFAGRMAEGRENNAEIDKLNAEIERLQKECEAHARVPRDFKRITTNLANEIDENDKIADEEEARLEKEADWLARELAQFCSRMVCDGCPHGVSLEGNTQLCEILSFGVNSPQNWREAARKSVEEQCKNN